MRRVIPHGKLIAILLLMATQLYFPPLFSQSNKPINLSADWEVWYDKVPVSGEIRVGLVAKHEDASINPTSFYVMIPANAENYLQCEVSSRDGRYEASLTYDIGSLGSGVHQFALPTKHVNDLKGYKESDITILASVSANSGSEPKYYTIASWKPLDQPPSKIMVYLNSERTTTIVAINNSTKEKKEFPCRKIEEPTSIAYNSVCEIPAHILTATTDLFIKQRVRIMNKITYNSYPISIKTP